MHTGNKHDYLGVDLEFNDDGTLNVLMANYCKCVIAEFPEMITGKAAMPAANHLFTIRDKREARALKEERALIFHHTVAQLLFMLMRARCDIQTAVAFLTTRVKSPDKDDWGQLKHALCALMPGHFHQCIPCCQVLCQPQAEKEQDWLDTGLL